MTFKPKSKLKTGTKKQLRWPARIFRNFRAPGMNNRLGSSLKKILPLVIGLGLFIYLLTSFFTLGQLPKRTYPAEHGYYINEIPASSPLIFPHIDHATVLKEIGIRGLYTIRTDIEGRSSFVLKHDDKPLSDDEKKKTSDQILLVKKSFLDHGKLVYRKSTTSPEIVVVTLIDFESTDLNTIVSVVQNRVDYAQKHKYGVYVRWLQEFVPILQNQDLQKSQEYIKPLIMRAAIHAFPQAKYIFFVDHTSLIMNLDLTLQQHLLDPNVLDMALLRNVPVIPGSNIKTYTHFNVDTTRVIIPQSYTGELDLSSMVVSTDLHGKAFLEYLIDPLYRSYEWDSFSASVAHILQWHPQLLGKTALVVQKLISAPYDVNSQSDANSAEKVDALHYTDGDFVVSLEGCKLRGTCASDIESFYSKIKKN